MGAIKKMQNAFGDVVNLVSGALVEFKGEEVKGKLEDIANCLDNHLGPYMEELVELFQDASTVLKQTSRDLAESVDKVQALQIEVDGLTTKLKASEQKCGELEVSLQESFNNNE